MTRDDWDDAGCLGTSRNDEGLLGMTGMTRMKRDDYG